MVDALSNDDTAKIFISLNICHFTETPEDARFRFIASA